MEDRDLRQRDLIPVFGSSSVASDVLTGKRGISKQHARRLAEFFSVPVGLFVCKRQSNPIYERDCLTAEVGG